MLDALVRLAILSFLLLVFHDAFKKNMTITSSIDRPLTDSNVVLNHIALLESYGIEYPWVVMAQEVHETGWFTSPIYRENFNRFGMKVNSRKYHKGEARGHAKYDNFIASILDYRDWQRMRLEQNLWVYNDSTYIEMLIKVKYAEDPHYKERVVEARRKLKEMAAILESH